jgi:O-methyltransferase
MPRDLQIAEREVAILLQNLAATEEVSGDVVEFGCYMGDTSVKIAEVMKDWPEKWLWLYDSFEGLPEKTAEDKSGDGWAFRPGELKASAASVASKFKKLSLPEPVIMKAWFNELDANEDLPSQISFALLDGDYYESIKTSLSLVAPKLSRGGKIVVHDYRNSALPGSAKAVNEFLENNPNFKLRLSSGLAIIELED